MLQWGRLIASQASEAAAMRAENAGCPSQALPKLPEISVIGALHTDRQSTNPLAASSPSSLPPQVRC